MNKPKISLIAAIGTNRALGKNNDLIYKIPEDLKRFKELTSGHPIIMGRKTLESIGRPLPNRTNIVVTRVKSQAVRDEPRQRRESSEIEIANSLDEAFRLASLAQGNNEVFVIGGGQIFEQAINLADKLYLTVVDDNPEADVYFPHYSDFKKIVSEEFKESDGYKYKFLTLEK